MKLKLLAALGASMLMMMATGCSDDDDDTTLTGGSNDTIIVKDTVTNKDTVTTVDTTEVTVDGKIRKTLTSPVIVDDSIKANEIVTLDASVTYTLDGFVFVENGAELHIPAGTVLKGNPGQGADASALIICKGAKIYAEGTAENPIIFTASTDQLADIPNLLPTDNGLWGGLIVLGEAPLNFITNDGSQYGGSANIEGIPETEERGQYGGSVATDNSGVIKYVSIRHGGTNIGADNEINGLSLGAVGSGTTIEHVEIFANADDGIEFFGGTVNVKYAAITYCGDDSFDYDESFRGNGQFWFTQKAPGSDKCGEHDGGPSSNETGTPYAIPHIYNVTYIGTGMAKANSETSTDGVKMRDNAGGHYANSIFANFYGTGFKIEDLADGGDSKKQVDDGNLTIKNNVFFNVGNKTEAAVTDISKIIKLDFASDSADYAAISATYEDDTKAAFKTTIEAWGNTIEDPALGSYDAASIDPVPAADVAGTLAAYPDNAFFEAVTYKGAFKAGDNWLKGWTALDHYGLLK